eukprot:SM000191S05230  [mRNA]  locus=s191:138713:140429:+ [translate_table: standard]
MEIVHVLLDLVVPVVGVFNLALAVPFVWALRLARLLYYSAFPDNVRDKVVLITGASSSLGLELAYEYASRGARLVLAAKDVKGLDQVATILRRKGSPTVAVVHCDPTVAQDAKTLVETTIGVFGRLDHLVLNPGTAHKSLMQDLVLPYRMREIFDTTFWGDIYTTFYALPHLKASKGVMAVTASVAAYVPISQQAIYNAANASLVEFYDTLRVEIGNDLDITVVAPGMDSEAPSIEKSREIAKAYVRAVVRRRRMLVLPGWCTALLIYRLVAPNFLEAFFRVFHISNSSFSCKRSTFLWQDFRRKYTCSPFLAQ